MVSSTTIGLIYDEPAYLAPVKLLKQHGLTLTFLRNYPEPAGILHNIIHWMLEPITLLEPQRLRLVNPIFLCLTAICTYLILRLLRSESPLASALTLVGIPVVWVLSGMALTELPAILLGQLSIFLVLLSIHRFRSDGIIPVALSMVGGICLGIGFLSRPNILVIAFAAPALIQRNPALQKTLHVVIAYLFGASLIPISLILLWGGLTPPGSAVHNGVGSVSYEHLLMSLCYVSVIMLIVAPRWFSSRSAIVYVIATAAMIGNMVFGPIEIDVARSAMQYLPVPFDTWWSRVIGSIFVSLSILFVAGTVKNMRDHAFDPSWLFVCVAMILMVASAGKITHQYSSRYTGLASGVIILASDAYSPASIAKSLRVVFGMSVGIICLLTYYAS